MFNKLVPVVALALLAGPVMAADQPATGTTPAASEQPAKASKSHKKHHSKKAKADTSKDQSNTPAK